MTSETQSGTKADPTGVRRWILRICGVSLLLFGVAQVTWAGGAGGIGGSGGSGGRGGSGGGTVSGSGGGVPEINAGSAISGITLLSGGLLLFADRIGRRKSGR
jgi:hypothetical protein